MIDFKPENTEINRLRFVFDDAVVSCGLPIDATLEDIACSLDTLVSHHDGAPIAIDVMLAAQ
jgi:hypothetical protein